MKLVLLAFAACIAGAQSGITFSLSEPLPGRTKPGWHAGDADRILTIKKKDPRAVEMFTFDVVNANGHIESTYQSIVEDKIAPVMTADETVLKLHPYLGNTAGKKLTLRNMKVVWAGEENRIVKLRDEAVRTGRTFRLSEVPPEPQGK